MNLVMLLACITPLTLELSCIQLTTLLLIIACSFPFVMSKMSNTFMVRSVYVRGDHMNGVVWFSLKLTARKTFTITTQRQHEFYMTTLVKLSVVSLLVCLSVQDMIHISATKSVLAEHQTVFTSLVCTFTPIHIDMWMYF